MVVPTLVDRSDGDSTSERHLVGRASVVANSASYLGRLGLVVDFPLFGAQELRSNGQLFL